MRRVICCMDMEYRYCQIHDALTKKAQDLVDRNAYLFLQQR